jgi:hypothetical protein
MKRMTPIDYLGSGIALVVIFITIIKLLPSDPIACDRNSQDNPHLSCGEKILLIPPGGKSRDDKQKGVEAFKSGHYPSAITYLQRDWNLDKDPGSCLAITGGDCR